MQAIDDLELLREFAANHSEAAFETLVSRRVGFVYSCALRQVRDPHLAEEITQAVFIILAQKAGRLRDGTVLTGWLFQTTRFTALAHLRAAAQRKRREHEAHMQSEIPETETDALWEQLSPVLDQALAELGTQDRQALLLRFFENRSFAEVGAQLGAGEDTARKRVSRALEKMRRSFLKRGIASTTAIISAALSAHSASAAPAALAGMITATAAKGAIASSQTLSLIKGALKLMAWTKAKTAVVVGACVLLAAGTAVVVAPRIDFHPHAVLNEPWHDAGAATPRAALQSLAWALANDQWDRAQQLIQWNETGRQYVNDPLLQEKIILMMVLSPAIKDLASFRVVSSEPGGQPDELNVKIEKSFKARNFHPMTLTARLRRTGGQWRVEANAQYFQDNSQSTLLPFTGSF